MEKLVWRVKLVAETAGGPATEIEVARIERDPYAQLETLGLTLEDGKQRCCTEAGGRIFLRAAGAQGF